MLTKNIVCYLSAELIPAPRATRTETSANCRLAITPDFFAVLTTESATGVLVQTLLGANWPNWKFEDNGSVTWRSIYRLPGGSPFGVTTQMPGGVAITRSA